MKKIIFTLILSLLLAGCSSGNSTPAQSGGTPSENNNAAEENSENEAPAAILNLSSLIPIRFPMRHWMPGKLK